MKNYETVGSLALDPDSNDEETQKKRESAALAEKLRRITVGQKTLRLIFPIEGEEKTFSDAQIEKFYEKPKENIGWDYDALKTTSGEMIADHETTIHNANELLHYGDSIQPEDFAEEYIDHFQKKYKISREEAKDQFENFFLTSREEIFRKREFKFAKDAIATAARIPYVQKLCEQLSLNPNNFHTGNQYDDRNNYKKFLMGFLLSPDNYERNPEKTELSSEDKLEDYLLTEIQTGKIFATLTENMVAEALSDLAPEFFVTHTCDYDDYLNSADLLVSIPFKNANSETERVTMAIDVTTSPLEKTILKKLNYNSYNTKPSEPKKGQRLINYFYDGVDKKIEQIVPSFIVAISQNETKMFLSEERPRDSEKVYPQLDEESDESYKNRILDISTRSTFYKEESEKTEDYEARIKLTKEAIENNPRRSDEKLSAYRKRINEIIGHTEKASMIQDRSHWFEFTEYRIALKVLYEIYQQTLVQETLFTDKGDLELNKKIQSSIKNKIFELTEKTKERGNTLGYRGGEWTTWSNDPNERMKQLKQALDFGAEQPLTSTDMSTGERYNVTETKWLGKVVQRHADDSYITFSDVLSANNKKSPSSN